MKNNYHDKLLKDLYIAYLDARKHKRNTEDEFRFEMHAYENIMLLRQNLENRTYRTSGGIAFISTKPVIREIFAAPFQDRIVHHLLYNYVYDWWDRHFIYDAYSCRKNKGTLLGIERLRHFEQSVSENYTVNTFVLKLDIKGYFLNLDRKKLLDRTIWGLDRQFPDRGEIYQLCRFLWKEILLDDPVSKARKRGTEEEWRSLPKQKSLFSQEPGKGIAIGNLTSQLVSNIYLDQLDRFITKDLGYRAYGRYVDDFYIIVQEKDFQNALKDVRGPIANYLAELGLTLHPQKQYFQNINKGCPFLGVIVYPHRIIPDDRIKRNFTTSMADVAHGNQDIESVISYLGHFKHFNSKNLEKKVFEENGWIFR